MSEAVGVRRKMMVDLALSLIGSQLIMNVLPIIHPLPHLALPSPAAYLHPLAPRHYRNAQGRYANSPNPGVFAPYFPDRLNPDDLSMHECAKGEVSICGLPPAGSSDEPLYTRTRASDCIFRIRTAANALMCTTACPPISSKLEGADVLAPSAASSLATVGVRSGIPVAALTPHPLLRGSQHHSLPSRSPWLTALSSRSFPSPPRACLRPDVNSPDPAGRQLPSPPKPSRTTRALSSLIPSRSPSCTSPDSEGLNPDEVSTHECAKGEADELSYTRIRASDCIPWIQRTANALTSPMCTR
ncbi:hypothetical protein FB451DRAFT_1394031 [Mycena latifolia]|nr:hypothetical protein FB451DRAFT_1394031 [Mycena latifolia]